MSHKSFDDSLSIEARQGLLDNKCEHKNKRHRTKGRKIRLRESKKNANTLFLKKRDKKARELKNQVKAYWRGEASNHPALSD